MANNTTASTTLTPSDTAMLDTFIPGYSLLSHFLISYMHIDLSQYIPYIITALVLVASSRYTIYRFQYLVKDYCVSTAEIRLDDEIYNYLMYWLTQQPFTTRTTQFVASTKTASTFRTFFYDDEDHDSNGALDSDDEYDEQGNALAFDDYWAKAKTRDKFKRLRFTPAEGTHYFWYRGRLLAFIRERDDKNNSGSSWMRLMSPERLYLSCFGRDPTILKQLLEEAQRAYVARDHDSTVIYRGQKHGSYPDWVRCMSRAPRPLSTVVLDQAQKKAFVADIKEYLHPRTRRWYSNRGIPYRRGYLLHGPPGTGKTSLCFATAGLLGVALYLLNLSSKNLDEDDLMALFQDLPRRCIVLLEDVDCAGMTHKRDGTGDEAKDGDKTEKNGSTDASKTSPTGAKGDETTDQSGTNNPKGISLSGLLNVIDGVAASEGRILVMTTNHPEKLDAALLRPGRVDMSIKFCCADKEDTKQLFLGIYSTLEGDVHTRLSGGATGGATGKKRVRKTPAAPWQRLSPEEIEKLAVEFAELVPEGEFSPAEIQGYLLYHKNDPEGAIDGVRKWVEEMRAKREKGDVPSETKPSEKK
ncbi:conserved hypothetical protein [Aspergillus terreus NIH2624]|uniref:Uncharacterized protein n=1 Tax=Aspergillus terreus (strain NIH 2624 / FGSC A1156) TaxID=341663 RepID=Q0CER6_ASPTN|nr:uncharacterized protein ATEG_07818 [Aspergillus terreus NIH2624]EAU32080.1 conserved hypothetical protein [Aspergillus terreus NIH2624]